jgi:hypothetical protein
MSSTRNYISASIPAVMTIIKTIFNLYDIRNSLLYLNLVAYAPAASSVHDRHVHFIVNTLMFEPYRIDGVGDILIYSPPRPKNYIVDNLKLIYFNGLSNANNLYYVNIKKGYADIRITSNLTDRRL